MSEKKICGLCKRPIDDGKHTKIAIERSGFKIHLWDCPYYIGINAFMKPVVFIPGNDEEEKILKELVENRKSREELLNELYNE
jgi:hypothetical protein